MGSYRTLSSRSCPPTRSTRCRESLGGSTLRRACRWRERAECRRSPHPLLRTAFSARSDGRRPTGASVQRLADASAGPVASPQHALADLRRKPRPASLPLAWRHRHWRVTANQRRTVGTIVSTGLVPRASYTLDWRVAHLRVGVGRDKPRIQRRGRWSSPTPSHSPQSPAPPRLQTALTRSATGRCLWR